MELALLRPVLEAAVVVARAGEVAEPRVPAPPQLRRFFRFAKLPDAALAVVRRVVESDEALRLRIRDLVAADPGVVGEAGWLFVDRPEGWEEAFGAIVAGAVEDAAASSSRRLERELERHRRASAEAEQARARAERARRDLEKELARERAARRAAEDRLADVDQLVASLRQERAGAVRELKAFEARLAQRTAELREAEARLVERERSLAAERERLVVLDRALAEAAARIDELERALLARQIDPQRGERPSPRPRGGAGRPARRAPTRLPAGLLDDTVEAAGFLLRRSGAVVLVDGYNVALRRWPDLPLAARRDRLVDALDAIGARTGASPVVVFDGADVGAFGAGARARQVQVRFSPAGVEADDVIIDLVAAYPVDRPVVVVSDDQRVRAGAREGGADVIGVDQLLGLLS